MKLALRSSIFLCALILAACGSKAEDAAGTFETACSVYGLNTMQQALAQQSGNYLGGRALEGTRCRIEITPTGDDDINVVTTLIGAGGQVRCEGPAHLETVAIAVGNMTCTTPQPISPWGQPAACYGQFRGTVRGIVGGPEGPSLEYMRFEVIGGDASACPDNRASLFHSAPTGMTRQ